MSSWRTHLLGYAAAFLCLSYVLAEYKLVLSPEQYVLGLAVGLVFSLMPDIDTKSSKIRGWVEQTLLFLILFCLFAYLVTNTLTYLILLGIAVFILLALYSLKHRGTTHHPIFALICCAPLYYIGIWVFGFGLLGFGVHWLLDRF